ncbi:MAG: rhodanese-like domain-containing protein [Ignavibacteriales bacterium]|nr:rhodanese-like domain-containing protein [Ignavibacteriales bacterium]
MSRLITPVQVLELQKAGHTVTMLDVREKWEFSLTSLPGALHIPLGELPGRVSELKSTDEIVAYCHHGVRSEKACLFLKSHGFKNVRNLAGGIAAWAEVDSTIKTY